ncbi:MAG: DUF4199 domain-containing protein [Cytophagales bacterium]
MKMRVDELNILKTIGIGSFACLLASVLNFYSIKISGENPLASPAHGLDIVILIVCIVFSVWLFRSYFNHGYLHLWQGIFVGFGVLIFSLTLYSVFLYVILENKSNAVLSNYLETLKLNMETNKSKVLENMSEEQFQEKITLMMKSSPGDVVFHDIFQKMMASAFLPVFAALFSALAMRKIDKR